MTNEQLATCIQIGGNNELIPVLWENVKPLIYMKSERFYLTHSVSCQRRGVELWDIKQAAYFAFLDAVRGYKPESGAKFVTFITFPFRNVVNALLGLKTEKAKNEPLNNCISLDTLVNEENEETIGDLQADAKSMEFIDRIEQAAIAEFIENEVEALEDNQCAVIKWYYYENKTLKNIGELMGITSDKVKTIKRKAEKELYFSSELRELYNEFYKNHWHESHEKYYEWQPECFEGIRREKNYIKSLAISEKA